MPPAAEGGAQGGNLPGAHYAREAAAEADSRAAASGNGGAKEGMRVVLVSLEYRAGTFSGNGVYSQSLVRSLVAHGHSVMVVRCGGEGGVGRGSFDLVPVALPSLTCHLPLAFFDEPFPFCPTNAPLSPRRTSPPSPFPCSAAPPPSTTQLPPPNSSASPPKPSSPCPPSPAPIVVRLRQQRPTRSLHSAGQPGGMPQQAGGKQNAAAAGASCERGGSSVGGQRNGAEEEENSMEAEQGCVVEEEEAGQVEQCVVEVPVSAWGRLDWRCCWQQWAHRLAGEGAGGGAEVARRVAQFTPQWALVVDWSAVPAFTAIAAAPVWAETLAAHGGEGGSAAYGSVVDGSGESGRAGRQAAEQRGQAAPRRPRMAYLNFRVYSLSHYQPSAATTTAPAAATTSDPAAATTSDPAAAGSAGEKGERGVEEETEAGRERAFYREKESEAVAMADVVTALSSRDARYLADSLGAGRKAGVEPHALLPPLREDIRVLAVGREMSATSWPRERLYLVCCVRLSPEKNAALLPPLLRLLAPHLPALGVTPLLCAGTAATRGAFGEAVLREVVAAAPGAVVVDGFMGPDRMAQLYSHVRVLRALVMHACIAICSQTIRCANVFAFSSFTPAYAVPMCLHSHHSPQHTLCQCVCILSIASALPPLHPLPTCQVPVPMQPHAPFCSLPLSPSRPLPLFSPQSPPLPLPLSPFPLSPSPSLPLPPLPLSPSPPLPLPPLPLSPSPPLPLSPSPPLPLSPSPPLPLSPSPPLPLSPCLPRLQSLLNIHPCLYDAYGMTVVEAAAFAAPSVIHIGPGGAVGAAELLPPEEQMALPVDLSAALPVVAESILALLRDRQHLAQVGLAARRRSLEWSEEASARSLTAILQRASL
ncbi:unnamed protein product [Closterium sp. Naga37s-1]|nr:unnamed protein product [Closterium sp. Naga37s-1]